MKTMAHVGPILAALKKHKAGAILIALQIALTLAISTNALCIIQDRVARVDRPTGMVESNLLTIRGDRIGRSAQELRPLIDADLHALRQLPGVEAATEMSSFPLGEDSWPEGIRLDPAARDRIARSELYFVDEQALPVVGARLVAGRMFTADDIRAMDEETMAWPAQAILTKALADKVYPDGSALGKPFYIGNNSPTPTTIIGIVDHLQASWSRADSYDYMDHATLLPATLTRSSTTYLLRVRPGDMERIMQEAPAALASLDRMRVFQGIHTFEDVREEVYRSDRGMATLMGAISLTLLLITAAGIFGLTSFWVEQRRKQIGIRRALGATRADIVQYFLTENLLIAVGGIALGGVLAVGLNVLLMGSFELNRISLAVIVAGMAILLAVGQAAVLVPAVRGSRVPPVEAIRSA
ncbi:ABC transporter permease [Luteimonas sp. XNQY3]|nr:FtsX-like permease family protein [Luteimonas sp. XNQY3]MCD9006281.1 ABC transporter permease [Luteimonas sp. XNQY3]